MRYVPSGATKNYMHVGGEDGSLGAEGFGTWLQRQTFRSLLPGFVVLTVAFIIKPRKHRALKSVGAGLLTRMLVK